MAESVSAENPQTAVTVLHSGCKINLFLDITGLRPDGRHELRSLFWPLAEPHDELRLHELPLHEPGQASDEGFRLVCNSPEVDPQHNTLYSAWKAFAAATGFAPPMVLELHKNVPTGAGLGGGSANAAALLLWLNAKAGPCALRPQELIQLAAGVGADVPFFLLNRPALGTGIGEILQPCPEAALYAGLTLLLVCPAVSVSTGAAFRAYDQTLAPQAPAENFYEPASPQEQGGRISLAGRNCALTNAGQADKEIHSLSMPMPGLLSAHHVRNSLEPVVFDMHPELSRIKVELLRHGAAASGMSGSGSSLFGLFRDASVARQAAQAVQGPEMRVWVQELRS